MKVFFHITYSQKHFFLCKKMTSEIQNTFFLKSIHNTTFKEGVAMVRRQFGLLITSIWVHTKTMGAKRNDILYFGLESSRLKWVIRPNFNVKQMGLSLNSSMKICAYLNFEFFGYILKTRFKKITKKFKINLCMD